MWRRACHLSMESQSFSKTALLASRELQLSEASRALIEFRRGPQSKTIVKLLRSSIVRFWKVQNQFGAKKRASSRTSSQHRKILSWWVATWSTRTATWCWKASPNLKQWPRKRTLSHEEHTPSSQMSSTVALKTNKLHRTSTTRMW